MMKSALPGALAAIILLAACKADKGTEPPATDARILAVIPSAVEAGTLARFSVAGEKTRFSDSIWLEKGETRIQRRSTESLTDTGISAEFAIPSDAATGNWDLAIAGRDGAATIRLSEGVAILPPTQWIKRITNGVEAGPQAVQIDFQGTRLLGSRPSVRFGRGAETMALSEVRVNSDTSLTVFFVALAEDGGKWDVEVSQPGRTLYGIWGLDPIGAPASLIGVQPDSIERNSDARITITGIGTHFRQATATVWLSRGSDSIGTTKLGRGTDPFTEWKPLSDTQLEAFFRIPTDAVIGDWDVHVSQPWYKATLPKALNIHEATARRIVSVSPSEAKAGDDLFLTITGARTRFQQGTQTHVRVFLAKDGDTVYESSASNFRFVEDSAVTTSIARIRADARPGAYDVLVHYTDLASRSGADQDSIIEPQPLRGGFTIRAPDSVKPETVTVVPRILAVTPAAVEAGTLIRLAVTGEKTRFTNTVWLEKAGTRIACRIVEALTDSSFVAEFAIPSEAATGTWDLAVSQRDPDPSVRLPGGLVVTPPTRWIKRITNGVEAGPQAVHIDFQATRLFNDPPSFVRFVNGSKSMVMDRVAVNTDTSLTVYFTAQAADSGTWDVLVSQPGNILFGRWRLNVPSTPTARLVRVSPDSSERSIDLELTVTGTGTLFRQATATIWLSHGADSLGTSVPLGQATEWRSLSDTELEANFHIPSGAALGNWDVHVRQPWYAASLPNALCIVDSMPPRITAVSPASAKAGDMLALSITGARTHFGQSSQTLVNVYLAKDGDTVYHSTNENFRSVGATAVSTLGSRIRADAQPGDYDVLVHYYVPTGHQIAGQDPGTLVEPQPLRNGLTIRSP